MHANRKRRLVTIATVGLLALGGAAASLITALPAAAATVCDQFGSVTAGDYRIMNNRWGTSATQCINTTSNGFSITQQDGVGNTSGAPTAYPAIYLGCHYSSCSPSSALPRQINTIGSAPNSISVSYPGSGTWDAAYDVWLNADNNTTGVQDTEIMIWLNRQGSIQPIGSPTGTVTIAGRSWQVWTGSNGANNVVSYLFQGSPLTTFSFDLVAFINDTFSRGSQYGNASWWLTSVQAGFEPWIGGVGLTVNSFSSSVSGGSSQNPPGTPGTPVASGVTASSVGLTWSASSGTVSNYQIERCTGSNCTNFSQVGTSTTTSFTNSGLNANTLYRYRVRATNSSGNSSYSGIVNVTTGSSTGCAPTNLMVTGTTSSSISLSWSPTQSSCNTVAYEVFRAPGSSGGSFNVVGQPTSPSYTDGGLSSGSTFRYQVRARDNQGNVSSFTSTVTATTGSSTQPPGTPGTLGVASTTSSTVNLTWGASSGTVTNYQVERCTGANCTNFVQVTTSTSTSLADGGLSASTTYRYRVRAANSAGVSGYTNVVNATTAGGGGGGGCSAALTVQTGWNSGYVMQPNTVTNTGSSTINGWTVTFTLPSGHAIVGYWNATVTVSGQTVTARGISGQNATLGAGASTTFGFPGVPTRRQHLGSVQRHLHQPLTIASNQPGRPA